MTEDIQFTWRPFKAHRERFFTQYGGTCVAVILFVLAVGGWNVLSMKDYAKGLVQPKGLQWYCVKRLLPGIALAAIAAGACFALVPKISDQDIHVSHGVRYWYFDSLLANDIDEQLGNSPDILARPEPEIADFLLKSLENTSGGGRGLENLATGLKLNVEDSPGNFSVEKKPAEVIVRVYDRIGRASVKRHPIGAKTTPTQPDRGPKSDRRSQLRTNRAKVAGMRSLMMRVVSPPVRLASSRGDLATLYPAARRDAARCS